MKKFVFLLTLTVLLVACSDTNELDDFTERYNKSASFDEIDKLNPADFGEIEKEENMSWQKLLEADGYSIDAKYEDGENLSGFYLVIDRNQPFEDYEGDGYRASLAIAKALGLSASNFVGEFRTAIREGSHSYTENNYRITFSYTGESGLTSVGMIINYDKR